MNLWLRVAVVSVAVVAAALLLKAVPPVVVLVLFVLGAAYAYRRLRPRARVQRTGAELLGLKRETADPFGLLGYPLALFGRTTEPAIDELVWGRWRSIDVHVFVVSFRAPALLDEEVPRASFACAMAQADTSIAPLVAEPQSFVTMLERPPVAGSVQTEDAAFDRAMNVWCDDESFAQELLGEPMRGWLRTLDTRWGVEVSGRIAMVYGPQPDQPDVVAILSTLWDLIERLPRAQGASRPPVA